MYKECVFMSNDKKKPLSPFGVRMTEEMRAKVEERAKQNGRSMNAEVIQILKEALTDTKQTAA
jgi:predicted HicB family RNase H-like nuclease